MSVHTEWMNANRSFFGVEVVPPGAYVDAYGTANERPAIVLSCDSDIVIEGSRAELLALVARLQETLFASFQETS